MLFLKHFLILFVATLVCVSTAFADIVNEANEAVIKGDYVVALKKYKSAASQGNATAQYKFAGLYFYGKGVVQNLPEALRCQIKFIHIIKIVIILIQPL